MPSALPNEAACLSWTGTSTAAGIGTCVKSTEYPPPGKGTVLLKGAVGVVISGIGLGSGILTGALPFSKPVLLNGVNTATVCSETWKIFANLNREVWDTSASG